MFSVQSKLLIGALAFAAVTASFFELQAQNETKAGERANPRSSQAANGSRAKQSVVQAASIHWQRVPLRDALARLHALFNENIFLDRRVDPGMRVSLDIESASAEEIVQAVAAGHDLGVARVG